MLRPYSFTIPPDQGSAFRFWTLKYLPLVFFVNFIRKRKYLEKY
jgi:hypothetical protein